MIVGKRLATNDGGQKGFRKPHPDHSASKFKRKWNVLNKAASELVNIILNDRYFTKM